MAALLGADVELARQIAEAAAQGEVCTVANDNDPSQVVISGHTGAIERAIEMAKDMGAKRAILLPVSAPFHCPLMQPAADAMAEALGQGLFKLMREGPEDQLRLTENAQPAIMAHALAVFAALTREGGVSLEKAAQFVAGHSLGEYSALCAAGSFDLQPQPSCSSSAVRRCRRLYRSGSERWRHYSVRMSSLRGRSPKLPRKAKCAPSPMTMTRARS